MSIKFQNSDVRKVHSSFGTRRYHQQIIRCRDLIFTTIFILMLTVFIQGCAKIEVYPASLETSERKGIPFYLQRPYVVVQKEFPIEGEEGYLFGTVDKATGMVHFQDMSDELSKRLGIDKTVPFSSIRKEEGRQPGVEDKKAGVPYSAEENGEEAQPAGETEGETRTEEEVVTDASGIAKWDSSVPDTIEINEFFKIVYLPDLDEKYIISSSAGIGTAKLSVAMGPGGVVNQFQINLDNSEIGKFVLESAKTAVSIAKRAAEVSIGKPFSKEEIQQARTIVVHYIYIGKATPGLYPILKNSEYSQLHLSSMEQSKLSKGQDPYLIRAEWPHTRFSMKVKRELTLSADSLLETIGSRSTDKQLPPEPDANDVKDSNISTIEKILKKDPNDIEIKELDTTAKFSSIMEDEDMLEIVFTIPRPEHTKFVGSAPKVQEVIKKDVMEKVYEKIGKDNEKALKGKNHEIKLLPK